MSKSKLPMVQQNKFPDRFLPEFMCECVESSVAGTFI
jgi:hypothetical protein